MVQKALKLAQGDVKDELINSIRECIPQIPDRRIKQRWEQIVKEAEEGGTDFGGEDDNLIF